MRVLVFSECGCVKSEGDFAWMISVCMVVY